MERSPEEFQAHEAANAIWFLEEAERVAGRNGWGVVAVGVAIALAEMKSIAAALPPASARPLPRHALPPARSRR